jgi:hypothetical protein
MVPASAGAGTFFQGPDSSPAMQNRIQFHETVIDAVL